MALNDEQLKQDIISITDAMRTKIDYEQSKEEYATQLMQAIKAYLTSATITITGTSNQGPFTGTGTIS